MTERGTPDGEGRAEFLNRVPWSKEAVAGDAPKFVSDLLLWATERRATDVHMSPHAAGHAIRARIDGDLEDVGELDADLFVRAVARVKVMAELDLTEHRRPQDGRFAYLIDGRHVDFRVSVMPTLHGESAVIRVLDRQIGVRTLEELGLLRSEVAQFRSILKTQGGLIVVTGPSGAGKTTTLYAALLEVSVPGRNVLTIEDPIEYEIPRATQTAVNPDLDVTFGGLLRSALRHDPDVILVGEVRDPETAAVAVSAALSGHLVLTSLHTQRAADAVVALQQYGIPSYALAPALRAVVAQQLVRVVCPSCRTTFEQGEQMMKRPEIARVLEEGERPSFSLGMGCDACMERGYHGRTGIFEFMEVDGDLRSVLYSGATREEIERAAVAGGMTTLPDKAYRAVVEGVTTVEEVVRVLVID